MGSGTLKFDNHVIGFDHVGTEKMKGQFVAGGSSGRSENSKSRINFPKIVNAADKPAQILKIKLYFRDLWPFFNRDILFQIKNWLKCRMKFQIYRAVL